jgi:hypothetical protein
MMLQGAYGNEDSTLAKDLRALQRLVTEIMDDKAFVRFVQLRQGELYDQLCEVRRYATFSNALYLKETIEKHCVLRNQRYVPVKMDEVHTLIDFIQEQIPWA